ncbi:hypothetical protein QBC37DRAFT_384645 [Rhypophila decipiens]|uniref:Uncharacterized protein n=1 Tax=Rhypophila decipiens TaxID=261697 RepID=A0AAN6YEL1_9PEZI|nr:hypothetical protein QBC37DRAFT_384645 [Rhypophila decipiens]
MNNDDQQGQGGPSAGPCPACQDLQDAGSLPMGRSCGLLPHRLIEALKDRFKIESDRAEATEAQLRTQIAVNNTQAAAERRLLRDDNASLRARIDELNERVEELQNNGRRPQTERTWRQLVRAHLVQPHPRWPWGKIYKQCCKEENMSSRSHFVHPNIRLQAPDITGAPGFEVEEPTPVPEVPFPFERLPWKIQAEIFPLWLHKEGQLVHPLSRLDEHVELTAMPGEADLEGRSGLPRGFYWGKTCYNVTDDRRDPNIVLRILLVSKRFFFIGVHCFYGLNTFAFSSLGEFDRFCNGIGEARIARLQHLELTWMGNHYLTMPRLKNKEGEDTKRVPISRRTGGLYSLQSCYRLRTMVMHINETGRQYIRRRYEAKDINEFMEGKTAGQPNQRMTRALRTVGGMDCIYQLRGLHWFRPYDLNKALGDTEESYTGERVDITDWSFAEDVSNLVTMEKVPSRQRTSQLENLPSLFPITHDDDSDDESDDDDDVDEWVPTQDDWSIVHCYFIEDDGRGSYDHLRRLGHHQDMDLPSQLSTTASDSSDSDSNDGSDSDSGGPSEGGERRPVPRRPGPRPSRGRGRGRGGLRLVNRPNTRRPPAPTLEQLIADAQNSDDTDSDLETDTPTPSQEDEEDSDSDSDSEPEVVEIEDSSDSEDSLFVRQRTGSDEANNTPQAVREDSVVPIPFTAALRQPWGFNNLPSSARNSTGSSTTPGARPRFRSSTSSGLFVSQSPRSSPARVVSDLIQEVNSDDEIEIVSVRRSPSVKSEPGRAFISASLAGQIFDLTLEEEDNQAEQASLPIIMEVDDEDKDEEMHLPEPASPTGSKRGSQGDEEESDGGEEPVAKRPKI